MIRLKNLCLLFIFSLILVNCSKAQQNNLPEPSPTITVKNGKFESKEGNFSINISHPPFITRNVDPEKDVGKQFGWRFEKTSYTIMFFLENGSDGVSKKQTLDDMNSGVRKEILRQGVEVVAEKEISFGKHAGSEFHATISGVNFIFRNYLINDMGYQISGMYIDEKDKKEVVEILDSFKLLNNKK